MISSFKKRGTFQLVQFLSSFYLYCLNIDSFFCCQLILLPKEKEEVECVVVVHTKLPNLNYTPSAFLPFLIVLIGLQINSAT